MSIYYILEASWLAERCTLIQATRSETSVFCITYPEDHSIRRKLQNSKSFCEASWSRLRTQGTAIVGLSENHENQSSLICIRNATYS